MKQFLVVGAVLYCWGFSGIPGLYPLDDGSIMSLLSSYEQPKFAKYSPGEKSPFVENHCPTPCQYHTDLVMQA